MGSKSDYLENELLDHVLRNSAYSAPAAVYLALFTADPGEAGSLANEVSAGDYSRQAITFGTAAASGSISNTTLITFTAAAANNWGTITHWAICDASTSGNVLYYGALDVSRAVGIGDSCEVPIGDLTVTED